MSTPDGRPGRGSGDGAGWDVASASVIGSFHIREQLVNQDSVRTWVSDDGASAVLAVADGHGHHLHFRSEVGAALATRCTLDVLTAIAESDPDLGPETAAERIVERWLAAVADHTQAEPFRPDQYVTDPLLPYGATLLAVLVTGSRLLALQIGDGDTVAVHGSGEAFRPIPEDPSLDGIHTASLCQPDPLSSFRFADIDLGDDPVRLVYLCTDGFGKARVDPVGWWRQTGEELDRFTADRGAAWVAEQLPSWLAEPAEIGGDDTTLALASRRTAGSSRAAAPAPLPDTVDVPVPTPGAWDEPTDAHADNVTPTTSDRPATGAEAAPRPDEADTLDVPYS